MLFAMTSFSLLRHEDMFNVTCGMPTLNVPMFKLIASCFQNWLYTLSARWGELQIAGGNPAG